MRKKKGSLEKKTVKTVNKIVMDNKHSVLDYGEDLFFLKSQSKFCNRCNDKFKSLRILLILCLCIFFFALAIMLHDF